MTKIERINLLKSLICKKILVLDGAMGSSLFDLNLTAKDYGGLEFEGCHENLNLVSPHHIKKIHENYLISGADIIETNTFGGTKIVLSEYNLQDKSYEINFIAAKIAREVADSYTLKNPDKPRFVAGSIGPTTKAISVTGGITFDELVKNFFDQAKALYEGGVDYFLVETCQDTRNIKAALIGINDFFKTVDVKIPIAVSGTIEPMGTMLAGQTVESLAASLEHFDLLYLGLNCATGPDQMTDHIRTLNECSKFRTACVPNAGLPDENGKYLETPEMVSNSLKRFLEKGWVSVIGGCCGTHAKHIELMVKIASEYKPEQKIYHPHSGLSGIEYLEISDDSRPFFVGERTNVIGSKKFKELISEGKFVDAVEIAKAQVKKGAHIIDVCLANPDRDEYQDMKSFLEILVKNIKAPIMIDSTDEKVIELALTYSQGKAIINSINLEDGEERFEKVIPLAKKYGAALVVGTIDDDKIQGMGVTVGRKIEIAKRSYDLLVNKYGVSETDIYWDPLVFPCATGDENYIGSAIETINGVAELKKIFPNTKSVLGISNVSFGLPESGREVLNSIFLYLCTEAGLDLAIVNAEKVKRYSMIPENEKKLAMDVLYNTHPNAVKEFTEYFRGKVKITVEEVNLPLPERLANYIITGIKMGLIEDLNEMLKIKAPLDIINGPLMEGMGVVGKLFNQNKLIVAEVLQSAEVMKTAVNHLEQFMVQNETSYKSKILLATVKGDVHDIGKNLVEIVLSNNGHRIINLGIKITSDELIKAIKEHNPDIVGLSGLLVKSAQQMVITAEDLKNCGIKIPILVGGAALSNNFVLKKIVPSYEGSVFYAKDAMNGLELANKILDSNSFTELKNVQKNQIGQLSETNTGPIKQLEINTKRSTAISVLKEIPKFLDYDRHLIKNTPIDQIFSYINPMMLYTKHLGINGKLARLIDLGELKKLETEEGGKKALEIFHTLNEVKETYKKSHLIPSAVYQFYKVKGFENTIEFLNQNVKLNLYRQNKVDGLCLSDYLSEKEDSIAMFVVTAGKNIREESTRLKDKGDYLKSHLLQVIALESAEAYAELLHSKIRSLWGFPDSVESTMMDRFQAKYRGKRYSFGYPACPNLADQKILFDLLKPQDIGVDLTDGFMMEPEASVSALCFHHPECTYFSVGNLGE